MNDRELARYYYEPAVRAEIERRQAERDALQRAAQVDYEEIARLKRELAGAEAWKERFKHDLLASITRNEEQKRRLAAAEAILASLVGLDPDNDYHAINAAIQQAETHMAAKEAQA